VCVCAQVSRRVACVQFYLLAAAAFLVFRV
jgi:hypothetical protein